jgi:hypothetical protein
MITRILVFLLFVTAVTTSYAQFNTGDAGLDAALNKVKDDGSSDWLKFKKETSTTYKVPEEKIETLSKEKGMNAGDIFMAMEVSKQSKKPVDEVITVYEANKAKGWGAISKELGIKPGSPEFHALKKNADAKSKKSKSGKAAKEKDKAKKKS